MTENIKLMCIGDGHVGKTSLLMAYSKGYPEKYLPTIMDNTNVTVKFEDKYVSLGLWDVNSQIDYSRLRPLSYGETNVFLICFSLVNPRSFENVESFWYPEIVENSGEMYSRDIPVILVGTKLDLKDDVSVLRELQDRGEKFVTKSEMESLAEKLNLHTNLECSAKTGEGLNDVFVEAIRSVLVQQPDDRGGEKSKGCIVL